MDDIWTEDTTRYNDETMNKVRLALLRLGLSEIEAIGCIFDMQNHGILFRERL